jgi:hypothetical protein
VLAALIPLGIALLLKGGSLGATDESRRRARLRAHVARLDGTRALKLVSEFEAFCNDGSEQCLFYFYGPRAG